MQYTSECSFATFYRGPDIPIDKVPEYRCGLPEIARLCIRYSELEKSIDYCKGLVEKGYKVFIQPMVTERYSKEELLFILNSANEMNAEAVHIVDSYGDMTPSDIRCLYALYDANLQESIKIGLHAHNNMEMALINTINFIQISEGRSIVIDSTCAGMGQGTGNLQTEVIANHLNKEYGCEFAMNNIIKACSTVNKFNVNNLWGYNTLRFIPAMNKTAYKYAIALNTKYGYDLEDVYKILGAITDDLRYRFCDENLKKLLSEYKPTL